MSVSIRELSLGDEIWKYISKYKNFKTVKNVQINQPTRCNSFSSLLLDVYVQLNMFRASSRPSSGAYQLQQQPLVYRRNVVVAVLLVVVGLVGLTTTNSTATTMFLR
jgi:hypothetical protein